MQKRSDDTLVAYLDGELDSAERQHVEAWLAAEGAARDRLAGLAQSASLVRSAYADIVNEPVPERLIAAARGETAPQRRRLLHAGRQRRRLDADRCAGRRRYRRGAAKDQPEPAAAGSAARSEAVGSQLPRRAAGGGRGKAGGTARLCDRQQGDRAVDPGYWRLQAAGYPADLRPAAGRQH